MTSRSFRRLFPQLNVQSIPEDEFYRQASLSQLLTGPDEQELASFRPDIKDPLELVEATPELAGMLGSSLEFVDTRWDSLEVSPPPTPSPPGSPRPARRLVLRPSQMIPSLLQQHHHHQGSTEAAKTDVNMWEQLGGKNSGVPVPAKPHVKLNANLWEPHQQPSKTFATVSSDCKIDLSIWQRQSLTPLTVNPAGQDAKIISNMSEQQNRSTEIPKFTSSDSNIDTKVLDQKQQGSKLTSDATDQTNKAVGVGIWEPQRLRSRSVINSDTEVAPSPSQSKDATNPANTDSTSEANATKQQNPEDSEPSQGSDSPGNHGDSRVRESQEPRGKHAESGSPAKPTLTVDVSKWERQEPKPVGGTSTATKREASFCDLGQGGKTIKMDAAWPRNLGNVRVHIRDLGMKLDAALIRRDVKKEPSRSAGKGARVKTRS